MARVTVEDCLEHLNSRFALVVLATRRTRQLLNGAPMLVKSTNKPLVTALREVAAGKVRYEHAPHDVLEETGRIR